MDGWGSLSESPTVEQGPEWSGAVESPGNPSGRAVQAARTAGAKILWWEPAVFVQGPARRPV